METKRETHINYEIIDPVLIKTWINDSLTWEGLDFLGGLFILAGSAIFLWRLSFHIWPIAKENHVTEEDFPSEYLTPYVPFVSLPDELQARVRTTPKPQSRLGDTPTDTPTETPTDTPLAHEPTPPYSIDTPAHYIHALDHIFYLTQVKGIESKERLIKQTFGLEKNGRPGSKYQRAKDLVNSWLEQLEVKKAEAARKAIEGLK